MRNLLWFTHDNSSGVSENVSDAATISTVIRGGQSVSAEVVAAFAITFLSIGVLANAFVLFVLIRARRHSGSAVHTLITNQCAMDFFACVFGDMTYVVLLTQGFKYYGKDEIEDGAICMLFEAGIVMALGTDNT